jgi:lysophospholipid acyltransferase
MVQINLNNVAASFVLLDFKDCIRAWARMYFYSHVLIIISTAFFHFGGRRALRKGLEARGISTTKRSIPKDVPSVQVSPPSPPREEMDPKDLHWIRHALDTPPQGGGEGMGPDGGFLEELMSGAETPRNETPRGGTPVRVVKEE